MSESGKVLTKSEAAYKGFDLFMRAWQEAFRNAEVLATPLLLTGQNYTKRNIQKLERQVRQTPLSTVIIANTHDGFNSQRFKHFDVANDNDLVGAKFAEMGATKYIICTNVDGVKDKYGNTIPEFNHLEQLNDINFYKNTQNNGVGGMEGKLKTAIRTALTGIEVHIVDGKDKEALIKVHNGEQVGTRIHFKRTK